MFSIRLNLFWVFHKFSYFFTSIWVARYYCIFSNIVII